MLYHIKIAESADVPAVAALYDELNDYLAAGTNYPGWIKGVYPTKLDAVSGQREGSLYIAEHNGQIAGSVILNHHPEPAYRSVEWLADWDDDQVIVIHTLTVHPRLLQQGVGRLLMDFAYKHAADSGMKSIRLDVYEHNQPAIHLYERCGYTYIDTVDLGLGHYGLDRFRLYERLIQG